MPKRSFPMPAPPLEDPEEGREEEDEEEEEEEEEEENEEGGEGGDEPDPEPAPEVFAPPPRQVGGTRPARVRKKKNKERQEVNSKRDWPREPGELWAFILAWLPTLNPPRQPSEVSIQVISMGGTAYGMTITPLEPKIRGDQVLGDAVTPPSDALMNMVIDVFHRQTQGRRYKLKFYFPVSSKGHGWENIKESEEFSLEDINTITQRRMAAYGYQPQAYQPPPPGLGAAPQGPQRAPAMPPPPMYGQPPWPAQQYGYPPYYPPPPAPMPMAPPQGVDPYAKQFIDTLVGQVNQAQSELAKLRGQPAPPPVQAPPSAPMPSPLEQKIDALIGALGGVLTRPVATGLGAAGVVSQQQIDPLEGELRSMTTGLMRGLMKRVAGSLQQTLVGESPDPDPGEVPAPPPGGAIEPAENPKDQLPFQEVMLEGKWSNGAPIVYTPSKDGTGLGGLHLGGFLTDNPFVLEKAAQIAGEGLNKLGGALSDAVQRVVAGGNPHLVNRVPAGAVPAGVAGNPQPATQQPPPQAHPQAAPQSAPPPPPPGPPPGGWPEV